MTKLTANSSKEVAAFIAALEKQNLPLQGRQRSRTIY